MKKFSLITALTLSLLFSGVFAQSAFAESNINSNNNVKVYYSMNNKWNTIDWNHLNSFFNKYFKNWNKVYWNKGEIEKPNMNTPEVEVPKEEKPQVEQPKPEQPKPEQPEVDKPVENKPVVEQQKPVTPNLPENKPNTEPPKNEQPEQNQVYQLNQFEQQVVELTNNERAKNGLAPLKADWELSRVARDKSLDLLQKNYFDHNSPTYGSPFDMMKAYGISYRTAGENIAKGQRTPEEVVNAWMNSPGHRANILNGNYTHIGVGYVEQGNHWTQMFIGK